MKRASGDSFDDFLLAHYAMANEEFAGAWSATVAAAAAAFVSLVLAVFGLGDQAQLPLWVRSVAAASVALTLAATLAIAHAHLRWLRDDVVAARRLANVLRDV